MNSVLGPRPSKAVYPAEALEFLLSGACPSSMRMKSIYKDTYIYVYKYIEICIYIHEMNTYIYVYIYIYMYIYTYMEERSNYIYIDTFTPLHWVANNFVFCIYDGITNYIMQ